MNRSNSFPPWVNIWLDAEARQELAAKLLTQSTSVDEFMRKIKRSDGHVREEIEVIRPLLKWTPSLTRDQSEKFKKSSVMAKMYSERAMEVAESGDEDRALALANMITAYSQDEGDLAMGHQARYELHVNHTGNVNGGLEELELARKLRAPPKNYKSAGGGVAFRKMCADKIRLIREFMRTQPVDATCRQEKKEAEAASRATQQIFTLKSPHPLAPTCEDFVEIKCNSLVGRHLIVTKDVPIGTTLVVEKSSSEISLLTDVLTLEIARCHHCHKKDFRPVPCPNCVFALFCSEECKKEASKYHHYECPSLPYIHSILEKAEEPKRWLQSFRVISACGPDQLFQIFQEEQEEVKRKKRAAKNKAKKEKKKSAGCISATSNSEIITENVKTLSINKKEEAGSMMVEGKDATTGMYDPNSYRTIQHLEHNQNSVPPALPFIALALSRILQEKTDYFQIVESKDPEVRRKFQDFVAVRLARHTRVIYSSLVDWATDREKMKPGDEQPPRFGVVICTTFPLSSHSCDPNSLFLTSFESSGLVAARDLKKGEEITRNYTFCFDEQDKARRQGFIQCHFSFSCGCLACSENWPEMAVLEREKKEINFCCSLCSGQIVSTMKSKRSMDNIRLTKADGFKCPACSAVYSEEDLQRQFKLHEAVLKVCVDQNQMDKPVDSLSDLKAACSFFQANLVPPSVYQVKSQRIFEQEMTSYIMKSIV